MTPLLYGIRNCDTVRKARAWLDERGIGYRFHDYKVEGVDPAALGLWVEEHGFEALLNRRGTTFRALPATETADLDAGSAAALMRAHPSTIRRPVLDAGGPVLIGFSPDRWSDALGRG